MITPTKRSDVQPLVEREKQFECRPVEISKSQKGKQMLHVLYISVSGCVTITKSERVVFLDEKNLIIVYSCILVHFGRI